MSPVVERTFTPVGFITVPRLSEAYVSQISVEKEVSTSVRGRSCVSRSRRGPLGCGGREKSTLSPRQITEFFLNEVILFGSFTVLEKNPRLFLLFPSSLLITPRG